MFETSIYGTCGLRYKSLAIAVFSAIAAVHVPVTALASDELESEVVQSATGVTDDSAAATTEVLQAQQPGDAAAPQDGSAQAGTRTTSLDAVTVTAQRRAQSLQEVPIAVTAIGGEQLQERGITSLSDFAAGVVPGLTAFSYNGASAVGFNMRGVVVADPSQATMEQGTAIYVDGVYMGRAQGLALDMMHPERIEVLRGPQGTLFGRNAQGGAVQIVTEKPTGEFGVLGSVALGEYGERRGLVHLNLPAVGSLSAKVDLMKLDRDGYVDNRPHQPDLTQQRGFGARDDLGGRLALRWQPSDSLIVDYSYDHADSKYTQSYSHLKVRPIATRPIDEERQDTTWMPLWNGWSTSVTKGHALTFDYLVNENLQFKSISSYREISDESFNQTGGVYAVAPRPGPDGMTTYGASGLVAGTFIEQDQRSQEFQLIGQSNRISYTAGLFYYNEEATDARRSDFSIFFLSPGPSDPVSVNPVQGGRTLQSVKSTSYAAYGQVSWVPPVLDDKLEITAGLRYTDDEKEAVRTMSNGVVLDTPIVADPFEEKRWDPALTFSYQFNDLNSVYLRYAQGYRAGGVSTRSPTFRSFGSEESQSLELGTKSQFLDNRVRLNTAIYRNEISGAQFAVAVDPEVNISLVDTLNMSDKMITTGLEVELSSLLTDSLSLGASYSYQHADVPIYRAPSEATTEFYLPTVPKHSGSIQMEYLFPSLSFGDLAGRLDYQYSSGYFRPTMVSGTPDLKTTINVLNGRLELRNIYVGRSELSVGLVGRNLLDKEYVVFSGQGAVAYGPPRYFGLEATFRYY